MRYDISSISFTRRSANALVLGLEAIHDAGGDINIPRDFTDQQLAWWLNTQRAFRRKGWLSAERVALLTNLGIKWDVLEAWWQESYQALKAIKDAGGDVNVPQDNPPNPMLGRWLNTQRMAKKEGTLAAERVARLEALGVAWDLHEATWQENYQALRAVRDVGGNVNVPLDYAENPRLGSWLSRQRMATKKGILAAERVALLTDLGVAWSPQEAAWQENYRTLSAIKAAGGDVNISRDNPENSRVAKWLHVQRMRKRTGTLADEEMALLTELGVVWDPLEAAWQERP